MVSASPLACIASITSPEQGAQQECSNTCSAPSGTGKRKRSKLDVGCDMLFLNQLLPFWQYCLTSTPKLGQACTATARASSPAPKPNRCSQPGSGRSSSPPASCSPGAGKGNNRALLLERDQKTLKVARRHEQKLQIGSKNHHADYWEIIFVLVMRSIDPGHMPKCPAGPRLKTPSIS